MWKGLIVKKQNVNQEIKTRLLDSMITDENLEFDDLSKEAEEVQDPEKTAKIIKRYEDITKTKRKDYKRRISSRTGF